MQQRMSQAMYILCFCWNSSFWNETLLCFVICVKFRALKVKNNCFACRYAVHETSCMNSTYIQPHVCIYKSHVTLY